MDEADRLRHRIAIMDLGKILVDDTPSALKKLIPGGNSLELHVDASPVARRDLKERLENLPSVTKVEETSDDATPDLAIYRVYAAEAGTLVGPAVQTAIAAQVRVRDVSVRNATLEEVFIYLTGRHLR